MATIGLFSHNNFLGKIIMWFTKSPITHAAIGFTKDNKQYWLHAVGSGVQIVDRGWLGGLYAEFQVIPNIENEVAIAEKKVGEPYSRLTLLGFAIMIIAKWFGIGINNPFYQKSAVVCSEFVVEADSQHLIPEFDGLEPANISPAALFDICRNGKSFNKLT
jgi:hypothetical protein